MSSYFWDIFAKAWHLTLPPFGLDLLLRARRTTTVSFGFFLRITSEGADHQVYSTAMRDNRVQYSPLSHEDEIRLFLLQPGSDGDIIAGHIEHHKLGAARNSFEALSYVWGDTDDNGTAIIINGSYVSVTTSLGAALRRLRYEDRPRTLWIDYLCINQGDIEERNRQVANMALIYEFAETVLMWLGEATPDTTVGIEALSYFANEPRPHPHPIWQNYPPFVVQAGLLDIMNRSWFQRVWVVQEVGRSGTATLICGQFEVKWPSNECIVVQRFQRMIKYAEILPQWEQAGLGTVNMKPLLDILDVQIGNQLDRSWGGTHRSAPDLLDIAHSMRHKLCTDPRDRLFGMLGLVEDSLILDEFKPDYNMTVGQMYESLARAAFQ